MKNDDLISRQSAIEVILADKIDNKSLEVMDALGSGNEAKTLNMTCDRHAELLKSLPSAQPEITQDGTLNVSIDADIANVGRILLSQAGTQRGGLYYKDEQPEETCDTCKYGYFGDGKCDYCRERYPSHYERRTDEPDK